MARAPSIDASGIAPVTDPSVVGGAPDASPTTLVLQYLRQRGFTPTTENVRRALEANQRDPGVIPGLRSDRPATEAEDQAAMARARTGTGGTGSGGGGGAGGLVQEEGTWDVGGRTAGGATPPMDRRDGATTSAAPPASARPATVAVAPPAAAAPAISPSVAASPPPATATANPPPYDGPTPMGDVKAIGDMISNGVNLPAVSGFLQRTFTQNPPAEAPPPAPAEPVGPPTPLPWVVRALEEESRKSNAIPAANPTARTPIQMYGGVPDVASAVPPPAPPPPVTQQQAAQGAYPQRTGTVVRPTSMMSRPPNPLEAALQRALQDRRNEAVGDTQTRGATVATR